VVAVAALALGVACKKTSRLEGHWKGLRVEGQTAALRPVYQAVTAYAGELDLVAKGNQLTMDMPGKTRTAEFTVHKDQGSEVVISVAGGDQETFLFPTENTMRWLIAEQTFIVFQKQKQ